MFVLTGIAAGNYHCAAWDDQGKSWTWGWGVHGQLGHSTILDEFWPTRLLLPDRVISIDCGYAHTLALTIKGQVWTFGCGLFGQLGIGEVKKAITPKMVVDLTKIAHISCGHFHNLAFDHEGQRLYTWGCNPQVLRLEAQQKRKNKLAMAAAEDIGPEESANLSESVAKRLEDMVHLTPTQVRNKMLSALVKDNQQLWSRFAPLACS